MTDVDKRSQPIVQRRLEFGCPDSTDDGDTSYSEHRPHKQQKKVCHTQIPVHDCGPFMPDAAQKANTETQHVPSSELVQRVDGDSALFEFGLERPTLVVGRDRHYVTASV